jgi:hypothetical protein
VGTHAADRHARSSTPRLLLFSSLSEESLAKTFIPWGRTRRTGMPAPRRPGFFFFLRFLKKAWQRLLFRGDARGGPACPLPDAPASSFLRFLKESLAKTFISWGRTRRAGIPLPDAPVSSFFFAF